MPARPSGGRASLVSGRSSARVTIEGYAQLQRVLDWLRSIGGDPKTAMIGTDLTDPPYPFFLEFGTVRMPAYPAARPAWDEMKGTALSTLGDVLGQFMVGHSAAPAVVIETSLREGARPIENRWKELARYETGAYRQSIHTEIVDGLP
jgi:hypothetical protein